jgi:saccharopine dehydrogenase (NAD+, L-lysine-forming)
MKPKLKIGILKETKTPPDRRTAIAPKQGIDLINKFPNIELFIQSSDIRAYSDGEYTALGLNVVDDVSHCDILIGVKEVHIPELIANKTYLYFSHTAKEQEYNRSLLQEMLKKNIRMLDYEYFTDDKGVRLVAFGRWAGLVGAYNGLIAYGKRTGTFDLKRAIKCHDTNEMFAELKKVKLPPIKIVITGGGRVAHGAMETLAPLNITEVSPKDFLTKEYDEPVFAQLNPDSYVKRKDGSAFDLHHFFENPEMYESTFKPFTKVADMYIACHFWDEKSPHFITKEDMKDDDFKLKVIADVSCDIDGPIASTIRASEIADPFYGYNPVTEEEGDAFDETNITVMAVDNLPGEVPRDASVDFGNDLIENVFPSLFDGYESEMIRRAMITVNGELGEHFQYLKDFSEGK